ncbi:hypothetical protein [Mesobacillus maritimus]|uniref:hypothetical protein n=1 Tax=Mesobacillus maritimus TaxID=1643336 RepID=UPI0038502C53
MNPKRQEPKEKKLDPPSSLGGMSPNASEIPGESIDEHRNIETANILLTGDEIRQQNENL